MVDVQRPLQHQHRLLRLVPCTRATLDVVVGISNGHFGKGFLSPAYCLNMDFQKARSSYTVSHLFRLGTSHSHVIVSHRCSESECVSAP